MKKITIQTAVAAMFAAVLLGGCVKDLDTLPLNENDFTSERAYDSPESYKQGLAKLYGGFVLIGQGGAGDAAEISVSDGGASELNRAYWCLQEVSSDAVKVSRAWNDPWVREVNTNTWGTMKNDDVYAIFARTTLIVSLVNEYLKQTADGKLASRGVDAALKADIQKYRAEARFIRAYVYWMGMDVFGNMPFITERDPIGSFFPPEKKRADLFAWIESELKALTEDPNLAEARTNSYPRVDKGAAWGLLARMYINAQIYTGTPRWDDAKTTAAKVISLGYTLADRYEELFMGDNGENPDANKELIFAIAYDKVHTQSFGGTTAIINGTGEGLLDITGSDGWNGWRSTYDYALKFGISNPDYTTGTFDCTDKRAMFYIKGQTPGDMTDIGDIKQGWLLAKYSKFPHNATAAEKEEYKTTFASTDFPMMRLAEMYLIYAEAVVRLAGGSNSALAATTADGTALGYLNALRTRAELASITSYDLQYIIDERARELMWEAHRRTDLIRFEMYTKGTGWKWRGGVYTGLPLDNRYNLCPYPIDDVRLNPNLTPTAGYTY